MSICAVIMAGGSGARLWPLSRAMHPKQFLSLYGEDTLLQSTLKRVSNLDLQTSVIICNEEHRFFVAEQLRQTDHSGSIILEPAGRNTAPAVALAALSVKDDPLLLVVSSDHVIKDESAFIKAVNSAVPLAEEGNLVTFGIVPTEANVGYGYIRGGNAKGVGFKVDEFVEKPSLDLAKEYIASEKYYWNSGIFLFRASRYLEELKEFRPDIYKACNAAFKGSELDLDFCRVNKVAFESCKSESIDYAVMEKTQGAVVVPVKIGWSDIGSWSALWDISDKDETGNVVNGDVIAHNSKNSYIRTDDKLVCVIGVDDLVVVSTKDAVLVAGKDAVQDIKVITEQLKKELRPEWKLHREVFRPWGKFDSVDQGSRYKVKRITVRPGAKLSVQMHHHRTEHWIVVSGTAKVTKGDRTFLLAENESTYISVGEVHALENCGKVDLELIEVQSGTYLEEDDIVRFEDRYGRSPQLEKD